MLKIYLIYSKWCNRKSVTKIILASRNFDQLFNFHKDFSFNEFSRVTEEKRIFKFRIKSDHEKFLKFELSFRFLIIWKIIIPSHSVLNSPSFNIRSREMSIQMKNKIFGDVHT